MCFTLQEESSFSNHFHWTIISGVSEEKQQGSDLEARNEVSVLIYQWQLNICFCTSIKSSEYIVWKLNEIQMRRL